MTPEKKLHICHISSVHTTIDTRVFYRECVSLAKYFEVTLIAVGNQSGMIDGVKVIGLPKPKGRLSRILFLTRRVYQLAKQTHADIYHFHDPELIPYAILLKKQGKQVVYDVHENVTESMRAKSWLPLKWLFIALYLRFDAWAAKHMHLILAEASYMDVYQRRYPNKQFTLIRNFAPAQMFKPLAHTNRSQQPLHIFYMGSLDHLYCIIPMIESIYELKQRGLEARLLLVGWLSKSIENEIKQLPYWNTIQSLISFHGYLDVKDGYKLSANCCMGYSFVSENKNVKESIPRKLYEYLQVGLPVISSGHPLYRHMVEQNQVGFCIDENTGKAMADAVEKLYRDKNLLNTFANNSIQCGQARYNWEEEEKKLIGFYHQYVNQH